MMDAELKAKWVAALRSGEFKQGTGKLHDPQSDSYCCLGVLCKVVGAEFGPTTVGLERDDGSYSSSLDCAPVLNGRALVSDDAEELSADFCKEVGITDQSELITMNDGYGEDPEKPSFKRAHGFSEIAVYIEDNL